MFLGFGADYDINIEEIGFAKWKSGRFFLTQSKAHEGCNKGTESFGFFHRRMFQGNSNHVFPRAE